MDSMKAIQLHEFGAPEVLVLRDVSRPHPKPGEVVVKLRKAGVSFGDTYMRRGYYKPPHTYATHLPYIPGIDGVGKIVEVGSEVRGLKAGEAVTYVLGHHSYAEYVAVPAWKVVRVPPEVPGDVACALMINGMTAYYLSHLLFPLGPEHTCLIHAGAGSVGQMLVQLARIRGAKVITTVGTAQKEEIVRKLGVAHVIRYRETDFVTAVRDLTGGKGVDIVYDSVGLETYRSSMKCLRQRGVCSLYGAASGVPDCVRPMEDLAENGSIFVTRSHLAHYVTNRTDVEMAAATLFGAYRAEKLAVVLDPRRFSLADAAAAHQSLEARETTGKILLEVS